MKDTYSDDMRRLGYGLFVGTVVFLYGFGLAIAFAWRVGQ